MPSQLTRRHWLGGAEQARERPERRAPTAGGPAPTPPPADAFRRQTRDVHADCEPAAAAARPAPPAPHGRQRSPSRRPADTRPPAAHKRSPVPAGRLRRKQSWESAPPAVAARASSDGAQRAPGRHHDDESSRRSRASPADTRPSAAEPGAPSARLPRAAAKSPLGAAQRPCRESSYELDIWKKNLAFMQSRLALWQQRAVSPLDDTADGCDTQPTRWRSYSSAKARVSPLKSPEQDFADALTHKLNTLLRRDEALARQHTLRRHSVALQPPRPLEHPPARPPHKCSDDWHWVDLAFGCGLGAGLVALGLQVTGCAFAARVAMVLAALVLAVLSVVLSMRGRVRRQPWRCRS